MKKRIDKLEKAIRVLKKSRAEFFPKKNLHTLLTSVGKMNLVLGDLEKAKPSKRKSP
jgi:hypothetical protein